MGFASPWNTRKWLTDTAMQFMQSPDNDLHMTEGHEPAFGMPLIGFTAGDDSLWNEYKEHVGPFHWTPLEAFRLHYPGENPKTSEITVMSWILPHTDATLRDNGKQTKLPPSAGPERVFLVRIT